VLVDLGQPVFLVSQPRVGLAVENLFLRRRLVLFQERKLRPRQADDLIRGTLAILSRVFDWRSALVVVYPDTLTRWHRKGFRLFWSDKPGRTGRPRLPKVLREFIRRMAMENSGWVEERIANELRLELGIRLWPRTAQEYFQDGGPQARARSKAAPAGFRPQPFQGARSRPVLAGLHYEHCLENVAA
jgi:putative transposase